MGTFAKQKLSASVDVRGIKVSATAIGTGTTIHTAPATGYDLVTIFASNPSTSTVKLTLGWGGTTDPDDLIESFIEPESGLILITADLILQNSLVVKGSAGTADVITLFGYVNRLTP